MDFKNYKSGALLSPKDDRDYLLGDLIAAAAAKKLPSSYINPLAKEVPIFDQGVSSECVACALSSLRWLAEYGQSHNTKQFSPNYIYGNRKSQGYMGEGMVLREALSQLTTFGTCFYEDYPGFEDAWSSIVNYKKNKAVLDPKAHPFRISSYYSVNSTEDIKNGVYNLGGVLVSYPVYNALYYPDKEYKVNYNSTDKTTYGHHAMAIVGWTETHWIVLNSWGESYGDKGLCYIPFEYPIAEAWCIIDSVMEEFFKMAKFIDTEGHWAEEVIDKAAEKGIIKGYEDNSFHPDDFITRAELCVILDRIKALD